jgi:hypothetical protein
MARDAAQLCDRDHLAKLGRRGARWGAINGPHGATRGSVRRAKYALELASSHAEPYWPTLESSFASRGSGVQIPLAPPSPEIHLRRLTLTIRSRDELVDLIPERLSLGLRHAHPGAGDAHDDGSGHCWQPPARCHGRWRGSWQAREIRLIVHGAAVLAAVTLRGSGRLGSRTACRSRAHRAAGAEYGYLDAVRRAEPGRDFQLG